MKCPNILNNDEAESLNKTFFSSMCIKTLNEHFKYP